jgi:sigma54-dependent transcription regulator
MFNGSSFLHRIVYEHVQAIMSSKSKLFYINCGTIYSLSVTKNLIFHVILQGEGEFKGLEGIAVNSKGNILVADRENHRVQIF